MQIDVFFTLGIEYGRLYSLWRATDHRLSSYPVCPNCRNWADIHDDIYLHLQLKKYTWVVLCGSLFLHNHVLPTPFNDQSWLLMDRQGHFNGSQCASHQDHNNLIYPVEWERLREFKLILLSSQLEHSPPPGCVPSGLTQRGGRCPCVIACCRRSKSTSSSVALDYSCFRFRHSYTVYRALHGMRGQILTL